MKKINTAKFKAFSQRAIKAYGLTVAQVGTVTLGALLTTKFLDAKELFKDKIAADPTYADKWFIKYQAPIKLVGASIIAASIKNPWAKLLFVGVAVSGAIGTVRLFTQKDDGTNYFQPIGNSMDARLLALANVNGPLSRRDQTYVADPLSRRDQTYVAKPVDLMNYNYSGVGGMMERGIGTLMERGMAGTGCASYM